MADQKPNPQYEALDEAARAVHERAALWATDKPLHDALRAIAERLWQERNALPSRIPVAKL